MGNWGNFRDKKKGKKKLLNKERRGTLGGSG